MDEQYRGSEAERPRPDPGRQHPAGAMPPQGGGETFPRRRRSGPLSAAPDLHGGDDQARRQTGGAGTSAPPHLMLCSPIELFHLIFPKERMQYYAEMTMRYAAQKGGNLVVDG
ncbi:hypothetical protein T06_15230, partial [Trichinella sp. T6]